MAAGYEIVGDSLLTLSDVTAYSVLVLISPDDRDDIQEVERGKGAEMQLKGKTVLTLAVTAALSLGGVSAWAGTTYISYNTTVGKLGGYGYSGYQTKSSSGTAGNLRSTAVGADYELSARTNSPSGVGTWTGYVVEDNTTHNLYNSLASGSDVRLQLKNRPQTTVDVQAYGSWRSN